MVGFDGQKICPGSEIQKGFGSAAQIGGQGKLEIPVFNHERAAHMLVVRHPDRLELGFRREIQNAFVEAHEAAMNPDLARFFLLAAFQNGGHLVGSKCFGHVEMDMITIEMGGENTGQITPPKIEFRQTVRQAPWGDPGVEQVAVDAAIGAVQFKQACVARRAAGKGAEGDHSPGAYPATPWPTTGHWKRSIWDACGTCLLYTSDAADES